MRALTKRNYRRGGGGKKVRPVVESKEKFHFSVTRSDHVPDPNAPKSQKLEYQYSLWLHEAKLILNRTSSICIFLTYDLLVKNLFL